MSYSWTSSRPPPQSGSEGGMCLGLDEVLGHSSTYHADLQAEALESSSVGWKHSKAQAYFGGAKV